MQRSTRIKKGDVVYVLTGREKGKTGKVLDIDHDKERAVVEKLMVFKRHYKRGRNPAQPEGGIVEKNGSIHLSNLSLIDPESKKPTRIGTKLLENGKRAALQVKEGDRVLFSSYAGNEVTVDGEEYIIMAEEDILAVVD